jgi:DNA sulfur modification protein DndD
VETYKDIINKKNNGIIELESKIQSVRSLEKGRIENLKYAQNKLKRSLTIINSSVNNAVSEVLLELELKVKEIFKGITNKPKEFVSIEFSSTDGTPHIQTNTKKKLSMQDISDGERQIIMLSLISALKHLSPTETLVVDAPFGRLDSKHIKSVVNLLPVMAPQIILLLTDREYQEITDSCQVSGVWQIKNDISGSVLEVVK